MPTSVHIAKPLLAAVDRKARTLKISRNRLIVRALEREVEEPGWPVGFFEKLRGMDPRARDEFRASMDVVKAGRRSKPPVSL